MAGGFSTNSMMEAGMMGDLVNLLGGPSTREDPDSLPPNYIPGAAGQHGSYTGGQTKLAVKKPEDLKKKKDDVWVDDDLKAGSGITVKAKGDDRKEPKYDILLRQDIGAQDMYLNLGDRDPGSDHCDQLVVKVQMPDTELKNITLEVLEDRLLVQSPKYRLNLALPHRVKKDDGKAEWEKLKATLKVTLPIQQSVKYIKDLSEALPHSRS
jgi:hypothetical protein